MDQVFHPKTAAGMNISALTTPEKSLYALIETASALTTATYPVDPTALNIKPEDGDIRITFHSSLAPTTTAGFLVKQGETLMLRNRRIKEVHIISASAGAVKCSYEIGTARAEEVDMLIAATGSAAAATPAANAYGEQAVLTTITGNCLLDDSIPQSSEGGEVVTATITLASATSKVNIACHVNGSIQSAGAFVILAIHRDAVANAIGAAFHRPPSTEVQQWDFSMQDAPAIAGSVTYKLRAAASTGELYLNGSGVSRYLGGASKCTLTLTEVL